MTDLYGLTTVEAVLDYVRARGGEPLFLMVSGSHMWNLARPDSDLDIRGVYLAPLPRVLSLHPGADTIEGQHILGGEVDLQLYEVGKALSMLARGNGNAVEMLLAPTVFYAHPNAEYWQSLARPFLTKKLRAYYMGYLHSQRKRAGQARGSKSLVYTYREGLAGICLLKTGRIIYDFHELRAWFEQHYWQSPLLVEFMAAREPVGEEKWRRFEAEWDALVLEMERAAQESTLPEAYDGYPELNNRLLGWRLDAAGHAHAYGTSGGK